VSSDIRLVILDGGGNEVLLPAAGSPDCKSMIGSSMNAGCQAIVSKVVRRRQDTMVHMAASGVRYVILPAHFPLLGTQGTNPEEMHDYAYPLAQSFCGEAASDTNGMLTCHFIDLRAPFCQHGWILQQRRAR
jgi:hypothetical protein